MPTVASSRRSAHLRDRWSRDLPAFGAWSILADPYVAELLASTPFDYTCLDLQHGVATITQLPGLLQAMRAGGGAPLVRVPWNEPASVMRALDAGAAGVIVPMVSSAEEARRAVSAARYPPTGTRSWGPMWGDMLADETATDAAPLVFVMIETRAGADAATEIVQVPGLDGVYIGPNDLALGCGHGRATYRDSAEVDRLIAHIVDTCREAGVVAGLHCSDVEMGLHWADRGARLLTVAQDTTLLRRAATATWGAIATGGALGARGRP